MLKTIYKTNQVTTWYHYWRPCRKKICDVKLIEFVKFWSGSINPRTGDVYPIAAMKDHTGLDQSVRYVAEIWLAQRLDNGEITEIKLRQTVPILNNEESSYIPTKNPVNNIFEANALTDSYEEYMLNTVMRSRFPNILLQKQQEKYYQRITKIRQLITQSDKSTKIGLFLLLRHKQSPTMKTFNVLQNWKKENIEIYETIIKQI